MLETNGHYLRSRLLAEQRSVEIAKYQEVVTVHAKENMVLKSENNDLRIENKTQVSLISLIFSQVYARLDTTQGSVGALCQSVPMYHENGHSTGKVVSTVRSGCLPAKPTLRLRDNFLTVNHWTRKEFRQVLKEITNAT